jgi:predicted porin
MSETIEVLAQAEEQRDALEELESRPDGPSESETAEVLEAADELKGQIERVVQQSEVKKGVDEPEGLRRARSILNRLFAADVLQRMKELLPEVDRLEHEASPPSAEELASIRPLVEFLRDAVNTLEKSLIVEGDEELPSEFVQARDLLHRAALLDLWRANTDLRPEIEAFETRQDSLTPEDITRLRAIPGELRPKVRTARQSAKQDPLVRDESTSPLISEGSDLLNRVQALVPDSATAVEEPVDAPETQPVKKFFRFYGSLRARALVFTDGRTEFDGQTSRIGVRAEGEPLKGLSAFTRAELGFNFLDATTQLLSGDPGRTDSEDTSIFFPRLLFVGAEVGQGTLSFGKQWSAYYDVAVFSDQMPYLAGAGAGVYNAETDGGNAGTGRADQALQYRAATGDFKYTGQIQIRNLTDNNQTIADTVGGSVTWKMRDELSVGGGFSVVRDGVPDAEPPQPKEDERAFIVGSRYTREKLYAAGTFSIFNNHETDDLSRFFSGIGLELYAAYDLTQRLKLRAAFSYLAPESGHPGDYRILSITPGASYDVSERIRVLLIGRVDGSTLSDGSDRNANVLSAAVFYNY